MTEIIENIIFDGRDGGEVRETQQEKKKKPVDSVDVF
jgi:hypothetical protein